MGEFNVSKHNATPREYRGGVLFGSGEGEGHRRADVHVWWATLICLGIVLGMMVASGDACFK